MFKDGEINNPNGRPIGAENKLTRKAKYLLNKYYDALKNAGIDTLVLESNPGDKLRAILAGIPKDMNIKHSGEIKNDSIDLSKLTTSEIKQLKKLQSKCIIK